MAYTATYLRMLGYIVTIVMHVGNMVYLSMHMTEHIQDPKLIIFSQFRSRYFTVWTFGLQILHAWVGLICDYLILSNKKNKLYKLPKHLKGFKNTLFSAIVWPSTWVVVTFFWSLYHYDRNLVFPEFVDKLLTSTSNHIMHTAIFAVVLWEVCFQPRVVPRSHLRNILYLTNHLLLYLALLVYTYMERSIWLYPIFEIVHGTIYFPMIILLIGVIAYTFYFLQWALTSYFWPNTAKTKKMR